VKIAIIGAGSVGTAIGKLLAAGGHEVFVCFAKTAEELANATRTIGHKALSGTVAAAAAFGDVIVLATPYVVTAEALKQAGTPDAGKILWDCTNALMPDMSGLSIGTNTSAGEEVQRLAPWARVVKAIPPAAALMNSPSPLIGGRKVAIFFRSDDAQAKAIVASLVAEIKADPMDAGTLMNARYSEPACYLVVQLYMHGMGERIGLSVLRE
jgi:predicted dinucleotide-binding enzyme